MRNYGKYLYKKMFKNWYWQNLNTTKKWVDEKITHGLVVDNKSNLEKNLGEYFLIAERKHEIIGYICGSVNKSINMAIFDDGEKYFKVDDLYVILSERSSGIGSQLLDELLYKAKANGINRSLIYSATKNIESVMKFYKKHDYKTWYVQMYK